MSAQHALKCFPCGGAVVALVDPSFVYDEVKASRCAFYGTDELGCEMGFIIPCGNKGFVIAVDLFNEEVFHWERANVFSELSLLFFFGAICLRGCVASIDENRFLRKIAHFTLVGGDEFLEAIDIEFRVDEF